MLFPLQDIPVYLATVRAGLAEIIRGLPDTLVKPEELIGPQGLASIAPRLHPDFLNALGIDISKDTIVAVQHTLADGQRVDIRPRIRFSDCLKPLLQKAFRAGGCDLRRRCRCGAAHCPKLPHGVEIHLCIPTTILQAICKEGSNVLQYVGDSTFEAQLKIESSPLPDEASLSTAGQENRTDIASPQSPLRPLNRAARRCKQHKQPQVSQSVTSPHYGNSPTKGHDRSFGGHAEKENIDPAGVPGATSEGEQESSKRTQIGDSAVNISETESISGDRELQGEVDHAVGEPARPRNTATEAGIKTITNTVVHSAEDADGTSERQNSGSQNRWINRKEEQAKKKVARSGTGQAKDETRPRDTVTKTKLGNSIPDDSRINVDNDIEARSVEGQSVADEESASSPGKQQLQHNKRKKADVRKDVAGSDSELSKKPPKKPRTADAILQSKSPRSTRSPNNARPTRRRGRARTIPRPGIARPKTKVRPARSTTQSRPTVTTALSTSVRSTRQPNQQALINDDALLSDAEAESSSDERIDHGECQRCDDPPNYTMVRCCVAKARTCREKPWLHFRCAVPALLRLPKGAFVCKAEECRKEAPKVSFKEGSKQSSLEVVKEGSYEHDDVERVRSVLCDHITWVG